MDHLPEDNNGNDIMMSESDIVDDGRVPLTEGQKRYMGINSIEQMEAMWETEKNLEEIKSIDSQLNKLNSCLDRVEKANDELNAKLRSVLESQKQARQQRIAIETERERVYNDAQTNLHSKIETLLNQARSARKTSVEVQDADVQELLEASRRLRTANPASTPSPPADPTQKHY